MRMNHTHGALMGHITDASLISSRDVLWNHYGDRRVKVTRQVTGALRLPQRGIKTQRGTSSKGAAYRLTTAKQPLAGSNLEPAHLEMARGVPRNLASKPATSGPDKNPGTSTEANKTSARKEPAEAPC
jgi:hypothetical protein